MDSWGAQAVRHTDTTYVMERHRDNIGLWLQLLLVLRHKTCSFPISDRHRIDFPNNEKRAKQEDVRRRK